MKNRFRCDDPKELVLLLAKAKAAALLPKIKEPALLITSDQVVRCHQRILEKRKRRQKLKSFCAYICNTQPRQLLRLL